MVHDVTIPFSRSRTNSIFAYVYWLHTQLKENEQ